MPPACHRRHACTAHLPVHYAPAITADDELTPAAPPVTIGPAGDEDREIDPEPPESGPDVDVRDRDRPARPRLETLAYQPSLDGIRFLGVTAFVLGHAGLMADQPQLIPFGWWMAVDLFFVMSGYLITTLLLRERHRHGRISLRAFYVRRVARLYPLIAVVVLIAVGQRLIRPDAMATPSWWSVLSMTFYFSNFQQLAHPADMYNAWGSLWSLAIEEQFYLVWPAVLIVLLGRSFNLKRPLVIVATLAVAISAWRTWSWLTMPTDGVHFEILADAWRTFYFSTFHRPDALFIGCAVALVLAMPRTPRVRAFIAAAHHLRFIAVPGMLTIVVLSATYGNSGWQVCWGLSLFNVFAAIMLVELLEYPGSWLSRPLSLRPFLWVGRRSYGIYVLHLAILMVFLDAWGLTSIPWIFVATAVIIMVAGVSYRFYENPIRRWGQQVSKRLIGARR